jgi:hypothetical protein
MIVGKRRSVRRTVLEKEKKESKSSSRRKRDGRERNLHLTLQ